ncbi:nuclear mitotic apparatus protein 1 [Columba livia]|uniref:Nuclear mitotic apparatus protein 1 n=1 Tax=Columba livia TaxID=8932 RepID=A0A2I0LJV2_COLLI|nr:nuclear mitotic apparatus protein 1 [Columba livia]
MRALSREHGRVCQQLRAEQEKAAVLETRAERLATEHREKLAALQADLSSARAQAKEKEGDEQKLRAEVSSLRERVAITEQAAAQRVRELEVEVEMKKLSGEVTLLGARLEETLREHQQDLARWEEEAERLRQEVVRAKADCAAERTRKAELEVKLQNSLNEQRVERSAHREELERSRELLEEKDGEMEELRRKNVSQGEELRDLQKTVSKLKGELAAAKVDNEPRERDGVQATCSKDASVKSSEKKTHPREQEPGSNRDLPPEKLKEMQALRLRVEGLEQKCREQQEVMAARERAAAEGALVERAELDGSRRDAAQQKEKVVELQKLLEASRSTQALHDATVDALRKELQEKGRELSQSKSAAAAAEKELASLRSAAQEKGRSEENWKEQVSQCVQELERKNSLIGSLEHEVSILHRKVTEKEGESKELKRLILAESEKSKKLEERLRVLQTEMATAASRAAERCSLMKVEVQRCQEEMEKQRLAIEALKRDRHCQSQREDELRQEAKVCQDKCLQKEQLLAALQQELGAAQAAALEERKKLLEERQKLTAQVEQLEVFRKEQTKQVEELNKKLTQHEKATRSQQQRVKELQAEATRQQDKVTELQAQLAQKEQAAEHYKGQMEKAKTHYDAKKQQNQDLAEKLKAMEQLQKENAELRSESERLAKELERSVLQAKESELSCRNLSSQVRSLEAQVEFANRQLRDLGKFQLTISGFPPQKQAKTEEPSSADISFRSLPAPPPPNADPGRSRLRSAASTRSLASFSSQESLVKLETSSPQDPPSNSALLGLPGYRPPLGHPLNSPLGLGRSSFYLGTCQDEPEQLDDWNRIAELQQRNRACPPHLKTCYPLESRPSNILGTITDEEMKTGDPEETLRRASMQPGPIGTGITTRQQRKRLSDESHQGPDTPESKKPTSCFPRPQTPRERRSSQLVRRSQVQPPAKQVDKRQSLAFSILNTPKKLGNSLLRRAPYPSH